MSPDGTLGPTSSQGKRVGWGILGSELSVRLSKRREWWVESGGD